MQLISSAHSGSNISS